VAEALGGQCYGAPRPDRAARAREQERGVRRLVLMGPAVGPCPSERGRIEEGPFGPLLRIKRD
jgi:hypothetical protein